MTGSNRSKWPSPDPSLMNALAIPPTSRSSPVDRFTRPFENREPMLASNGTPRWLLPVRKAGLARFAEAGLPTLQDEDWRFTNLAPLRDFEFAPAWDPAPVTLSPDTLKTHAWSSLGGDRLVFVDGHFHPELSLLGAHPGGVRVEPLAHALASGKPGLEEHLGRYAASDTTPFGALNQAYFTDGALIRLPADTRIEEPVHLLHLTSGTRPGLAVHPRHLILAGPNSQVTVIEHYAGLEPAQTLTNSVTELLLEDGARVEHLRFQEESIQALHFGLLRTVLGPNTRLFAHSISLGASLFRYHLDPTLDGEGAECVLNGLYLVKGRQLADHHMVVEHAKPHGASHEYFNGILADQARGVFHGRILVQPGAQKTDAKQTNKNLLLSDSAQANTKPQLEIYADDVKCTHGATIGQLDRDAIFYLRARGIPLDIARRILIHSFAGEITDRIQAPAVREEVDAIVWDWLESLDQVHIGRRNGCEDPAAGN